MVNIALYRWPVRVYYEDTDAGGVVYHASYLAFYERARTEMLRHYNINQQALLAERIAFVVRKLSINYIVPARLDDLLTICTEIQCISGASMIFSQRIVDADNQLLNAAEVKIACVDPLLMKPCKVPDFIIREFNRV